MFGFILALTLGAGIDFSAPEFQPVKDISGDYIVGSYDVSNDDFIVEELSGNDLPVIENFEVDSQLKSSILGPDDIKDVSGNSKSSGEKGVSPSPGLRSVVPSGTRVYLTMQVRQGFSVSGNRIITSQNWLQYFPVAEGITYYVSRDAGTVYFGTSLSVGSSVTTVASAPSEYEYTPSEDGYLLVGSGRQDNYYNFEVFYVEQDITGELGLLKITYTSKSIIISKIFIPDKPAPTNQRLNKKRISTIFQLITIIKILKLESPRLMTINNSLSYLTEQSINLIKTLGSIE